MPVRRNVAFQENPGIVLYHAARSNCSARVRLQLAEKNLVWESRLISLRLRENRSAEYFAINPKGLVPSLLIEDLIITESNDILFYVEEKFPQPCFLPDDHVVRSFAQYWMDLSANIHLPGIKTLNYSVNTPMAPSREAAERYALLQTDPDLVAFHAKAGGGGFSRDDRLQAEALLNNALDAMDTTLAEREWLASDEYGIADICWAPTIPTLERSGFDLSRFPHVGAWHRRIAARAAYKQAVVDWQDLAA